MKKFSENEINNYIREEIENYVDEWKRDMYMKLINIIGSFFYNINKKIEIFLLDVNYESEFVKEMLKEPDYYGLSYDAYRILTFNIESN